MELYKKGKVKDVYDLGNGRLKYIFTDKISVFDKIIPTEIPHKGETLCLTSVYWMKKAENMGVKTDFIESPSAREMIVKKVRIIKDYNKLTPQTTDYLIPLEVICRHYIAGSFYDRLKKGKIDPKQLGLGSVEYGAPLPEPHIEFTTKLEPVDRHLTEKEAMEISGLTPDELEDIKETVLKIDETIQREVSQRGLIHVDGKKEFGFDEDRQLMLVDTFGTADEDRWWDKKEYEKGKIVELSKEKVRQHYRQTGYHQRLMEAREKGLKEPDIPPLPDKLVEEISHLYITMYERITGEKFTPTPK